MESLLKNLKEHVTCSICLDTFTEPKTITCLHTFCFECIKKHALISQRNGKFRCPECQAEVDLPEVNRFEKLPTSFHHNSLLSVLAIRQSGQGNDISCGVCKKKSAEISYCFECASPSSVFVDEEGRVIVADYKNDRIQVLSQDGEPLFQFGDSGPEKLNNPRSCIYHDSKFIVSDRGNNCLKVFDNTGKFLYKIGEQGKGDGQLKKPDGLCLQKCGNHRNLLVCNRANGRVDQFTVEGCYTGKTVVKLQDPLRITTTPDGLILVRDYKTQKIHILK